MRLLKLHLSNFKGAKDVTLDCNGGANMDVFGDNETGKTTLFDAYCWLLFGKDSRNQAEFAIKTLNADGEPVHNLTHTVEAEFRNGSSTITMKKSYAEKYTRKKGDVSASFTGHETSMFIDSVPAQKKEWDAYIAQNFGDETTFKLLSNPMHFNENMHWADRRKVLVSAFGNVTDEDVIASDSQLNDLPEILGTRTIENHRKMIAAKRAEINEELKILPARIDEANKSLPIANEELLPDIEQNIAKLKAAVKEKMMDIVRIENGEQTAVKRREIMEIEGLIQAERNKHSMECSRERVTKRGQWMDATQNARTKESAVQNAKTELERVQARITELEAQLTQKRSEWTIESGKKFEPIGIADSCPACGQPLPEDKVHDALVSAEAEFNDAQAKRILAIDTQGKAIKQQIAELWEKADKIATEKQKAETELEELRKIEVAAKVEADATDSETPFNPDPALLDRIAAIHSEIQAMQSSTVEAAEKAKDELQQIQKQLQDLESAAATSEQRKRQKQRIEDLLKSEKALGVEFERLGREQYLTDRFIRARVGLLERTINNRFKIVKFKLFDTQVNGGLVECCETTVNGVPFSGGLNNAARINAGLDIINTLAGHFGFMPPVWVDNAEAVTRLIPIEAQTIRLVVSEDDKALRMESAAFM